MTDKEIKEIFTNYCYIIIDGREKQMHIRDKFAELGTHFRIENLSYGDYGIVIIPNPIIGNKEEILLKVAIERKNGLTEIGANLTKYKERFHAEMQRCIKDGGQMVIMIEGCTYMDIVNKNYRNDITPKAFLALLHSITSTYGIHFVFVPKEVSSLFVYNYLKYFTRNYLKNLDKYPPRK